MQSVEYCQMMGQSPDCSQDTHLFAENLCSMVAAPGYAELLKNIFWLLINV